MAETEAVVGSVSREVDQECPNQTAGPEFPPEPVLCLFYQAGMIEGRISPRSLFRYWEDQFGLEFHEWAKASNRVDKFHTIGQSRTDRT